MKRVMLSTLFLVASMTLSFAELSPEIKSKIDALMPTFQAWGSDPVIVGAVKACNETPPAEYKDMTNEKWKTLKVISPEVRGLSKNAVAEFLKSKKTPAVSEAFVSAADGSKVAFLSKPTSWTHKGKPKHDVPMTGQIWYGEIEVDESSGTQQVQVAVAVMDGTTPIGSLVIGLSVAKL